MDTETLLPTIIAPICITASIALIVYRIVRDRRRRAAEPPDAAPDEPSGDGDPALDGDTATSDTVAGDDNDRAMAGGNATAD